MFSVRAVRSVFTVARSSARSFSDKAAAQTPKVASAPAASAAPSGSTLGQRLSSCLVGMAIGYSVSFYMLTEELQESNRIFSERLTQIESSLNIK
mmetsp:Transcript_25729/g.43347  ORF Transcript_25729/g.43347 Transcript_25729/m.43347 type:complete len:95 (-) Transcript_25729:250-534(-)